MKHLASSYYYLSGRAKWAKLFKPDDKYKNWQIQVYMDEPSMAIFDETGMTMQKKTDDDGTFVTFRRPETKIIKDELVKFNPPDVLDANGDKLDQLVGNGSDVTVKVIVYDTMKGKGHRLEAVKVTKLVPYVKQEAAPVVSAGAMASTAQPAAGVLKAIPF
jgi:hypothetical protein